jgi:Regulator of competence-specific genes
MASKKETLDFVLAQLDGIENIKWRKMMGEYLIYYREKVVGGIYDDRFLVKLTASSKRLLPDANEEPPYEGAKPMLSLSDLIFDGHSGNNKFLKEVFESIYEQIK